jgi:hypothetical protein
MFDENAVAVEVLDHINSDLDGMVQIAAEALTEADHETATAALAMALLLLPQGFTIDLAFGAILRLAEQKVEAEKAVTAGE